MTTRGPVVLVARRELRTRMMTKANIVSMVVMLVVILVGAAVGRYFLEREGEPPTSRVAVSAGAGALAPQLRSSADAAGLDLELSTLEEDAARQALADERLDGFVGGDPASPQLVVPEGEPDGALLETVTGAVRSYVVAERIGDLGGDPAAFERALASAVPQVETLQEASGGGFDGAAFGVATVMISVLLFALIGSGTMIAMGVVEEKTSRVVEILLSTIRPTQLLAGKVLGIGLYGLLQVVVLGAALVLATRILGVASDISVDVGAALMWLVIWFLLGYLVFALLFGGFAALVSRQEDISSVTTPLMFLLFAPFYLTMFLVPNDPDGTAVKVLSQVPFFAPFMMPVRDAFGALAPWEMPLAIAICAVTIPVLVWLAARVYQRGVLHTGGRMRLAEALRG
ncbi:ABC transporter permease [Cellulomonas aerilata]|uniref:ABC transporter permease n=1 Tax=Cellulomonas aerilata TaxID=515326 RepID=A0A512DEV9_9CELL|nr:ABC transporter permease [Cellulomonas aerilata]GEO35013.1 ABC transporter permease [Cellulomonas aerilata]